MPSQPSWIQSVPEILEALEAPGAPPFLDRASVEKLFGVRRRQAIHLLGRVGGFQVGKTFVTSREAVIRFLREPARLGAARGERSRVERVGNALADARGDLHRRRIAIPARPDNAIVSLAGLPPGIRLESGRLTVEFGTPVELLEKLFALSQALTNDFETVERLLCNL
jgi:hypothetical protein